MRLIDADKVNEIVKPFTSEIDRMTKVERKEDDAIGPKRNRLHTHQVPDQ